MPTLGDPVRLNEKQLTKLASDLSDYILEEERLHATFFQDISVWWDWYHAVPDVAVRTEPWPGASNLVLPLIQLQTDAQVARSLLQVLSTRRMWGLDSESEWWAKRVPSIAEFLNYGVRRNLGGSLIDHLEPCLLEQQALGESYLEQGWGKRLVPIVSPNAKSKVSMVNFGSGPYLRHRPRERVLFSRGTPLSEATAVFLQDFYTTRQLAALAQSDNKYMTDQFEGLDGFTGLEGPAAEIENERRERMGVALAQPGDKNAPHDVRTCWVSLDLARYMSRGDISGVDRVKENPLDVFDVPLHVVYHHRAKRVLRITYSPYLLDRLPLYEFTRKRSGAVHEGGRGLAKDLEQLQRGATTVINQSIDAVSFANSVKLLTNDRRFENKRWIPNQIVFHPGDLQTSIRELTAQKQIFPDIAVVNILAAYSERVGGTGNPGMGQESKMGGHPSPATNFLGMLEQSQIQSSRALKSVREGLSWIGAHRAVMYQQFERNNGDWISRVFGPEDAAAILDYLDAEQPLLGQVDFDVHAFSEVSNPEGERQKFIAIDQLVTNHYVILAKYVEVMGNPQAPPVLRALMAQAATAKTHSLIKVLESAEIDNVEDYVGKLARAGEDVRQQLAALSPLFAGGGAGVGPGGPGVPGQPGAQAVPQPGMGPIPGGGGPPIPPNGGAGGRPLF